MGTLIPVCPLAEPELSLQARSHYLRPPLVGAPWKQ